MKVVVSRVCPSSIPIQFDAANDLFISDSSTDQGSTPSEERRPLPKRSRTGANNSSLFPATQPDQPHPVYQTGDVGRARSAFRFSLSLKWSDSGVQDPKRWLQSRTYRKVCTSVCLRAVRWNLPNPITTRIQNIHMPIHGSQIIFQVCELCFT